MGKLTGFMEFEREAVPYRDPLERLEDYDEINNHNQEVWDAWEQQDEVLYTHPSYELEGVAARVPT